jgi:hypothetical protein
MGQHVGREQPVGREQLVSREQHVGREHHVCREQYVGGEQHVDREQHVGRDNMWGSRTTRELVSQAASTNNSKTLGRLLRNTEYAVQTA